MSVILWRKSVTALAVADGFSVNGLRVPVIHCQIVGMCVGSHDGAEWYSRRVHFGQPVDSYKRVFFLAHQLLSLRRDFFLPIEAEEENVEVINDSTE